MRTGVDVSKWNPKWNANVSKANGETFVMIRAGYGAGHIDRLAQQHYAAAIEAGLDVGLYWFSYATTKTAAIKEAKAVLDFASDKRIAYPIVFDYEEDSMYYGTGKGMKVNPNVYCEAFCDEVEKAGYYAMFYSNKHFLEMVWNNEIKKRYGCWVAHYGSQETLPKIAQIWQYSIQPLDRNKDVKDIGDLIKRKGLNRLG